MEMSSTMPRITSPRFTRQSMPPRVPRRSAIALAVLSVKKKKGEESKTGATLYW